MTPAQLDLLLNGAFIYADRHGKPFASFDYKLRDFGMTLLRRSGPLSDADLQCKPDEILARLNQDLAA